MGVIDMQELAQMAEPWKEKLVTWVQELDPLYVKLILAVVVYIIVSAILKSMGKSYYFRVIMGMVVFTAVGSLAWKMPVERWGNRGYLVYVITAYLVSVLINLAVGRKETERGYDDSEAVVFGFDDCEDDEEWEPGLFYKVTHAMVLVGIAAILLFFVYIRISSQTQAVFEHDVLAEYENCEAVPDDASVAADLAEKGYKDVNITTEAGQRVCSVVITARKNMQDLEKRFVVRFG